MKKIVRVLEKVLMEKYYLVEEDENGNETIIDLLDNEYVETLDSETVDEYTKDTLPTLLSEYIKYLND